MDQERPRDEARYPDADHGQRTVRSHHQDHAVDRLQRSADRRRRRVPADVEVTRNTETQRMATAATAPALPHAGYESESGVWSWLTTVDHKRIGALYLYTALTWFVI